MSGMASDPVGVMGTKEIERILPHRYPFLLVDRVIQINLETNEIYGIKNVTVNEPFFQGHFQGLRLCQVFCFLKRWHKRGVF